MMPKGFKGWIGLSVIGILGLPATADLLVLKDGSQVETRGSWTVKGRLVVFTSASGDFASLRVNEVDLEASDQATLEAWQALEAAREEASRESVANPEPKVPILVLTDADVGHVAEEAEDALVERGEANPTDLRLVVSDWDQRESPDGRGVLAVGSLRNDGSNVATRIRMQVQVLDSQEQIVGTTEATLTASNLGAGDVLNFRAHFPELVGFDTARFDISGRELRFAPQTVDPAELSEEEALQDREPEPAVDLY